MRSSGGLGSRVALVRCDTYTGDAPEKAVRRDLELLGGASHFVHAGETILLKPNVLVGDRPPRCTTTHPSVLRAVARCMAEAGARLTYGDSSGIGLSEMTLRRSGLAAAAEAMGATRADFAHGEEVERFLLARGALDADGIVSVSKMKTHGFMRITGAVKNLLGCVPGLAKPQLHVQFPQPDDFAAMLVALNLLLRPRLHIMDGILAMECNGPRSGDPTAMNVLLASEDPVALDTVFCRLIDLDPTFVPTNTQGAAHGLGTCDPDEIEIVGDSLSALIRPQFRVSRDPSFAHSNWGQSRLLKGLLARRPVIDPLACVLCGTCVEICPTSPKSVDWVAGDHGQVPKHDYKTCIRCFCCQETCPAKAIAIEQPLLPRLFARG